MKHIHTRRFSLIGITWIFGAAIPLLGCPVDVAVEDDDTGDDDTSAAQPDDDDSTGELLYCVDDVDLEFTDQVLIPAGVYPRGADVRAIYPHDYNMFGGIYETYGDETPRHDVYLDGFCVDKYEVTLERYEACVDDDVCSPAGATAKNLEDVDTHVNHYPVECEEDPGLCPYYPVNCKNYDQAQAFCAWEGKRLCTEAEWERVANGPGPDPQTYPWGESPVDLSLANIINEETDLHYLVQVDDFPDSVSPEGVHNLIGNVYEWVGDYYAPYQPNPDGSPLENPVGPLTGEDAIVRGGCAFIWSGYGNSIRTTIDPAFDYG